jgi:hypothetical protein
VVDALRAEDHFHLLMIVHLSRPWESPAGAVESGALCALAEDSAAVQAGTLVEFLADKAAGILGEARSADDEDIAAVGDAVVAAGAVAESTEAGADAEVYDVLEAALVHEPLR